ncbi:MAG: asparagine synthase C-terminal domain-containing protein [Nanoarchaeota archaeon]
MLKNEKQWKDLIMSFSIKPEHKNHKKIINELKELTVKAVTDNIPKKRFGILFSGGVDSTLIAQICKKEKGDFICYTAGLEEKGLKHAEDVIYSKKAAKKLNLKLKIKTIGLLETEKYIKKILKILKEPNVVKVGVALPFYVAFEEAKKDKIKVMFSGLGSEELFAGYERHLHSKDVNKECFDGLLNMYERDITRDVKVAEALKIDLRVPFLEEKLIEYSLRIPAKYKLNKKQNKIIIREVAEELKIGESAWRKKRAAQYGSRFDRAIYKLARKNGFKYKKDYLESLIKN